MASPVRSQGYRGEGRLGQRIGAVTAARPEASPRRPGAQTGPTPRPRRPPAQGPARVEPGNPEASRQGQPEATGSREQKENTADHVAHIAEEGVEKATDNRAAQSLCYPKVADADSPVRSARRWPQRISPRPSPRWG